MKKPATAAEKRHMGRVAALGCLVHHGTPAVIHHLQCVSPRDNMIVIPLCPFCHTGTFSIHSTKEQFLSIYGSEMKLLADTLRLLA